MQTERRVAANPQTKTTDLGCESTERLAATIRRHHRHIVSILQSSADAYVLKGRKGYF